MSDGRCRWIDLERLSASPSKSSPREDDDCEGETDHDGTYRQFIRFKSKKILSQKFKSPGFRAGSFIDVKYLTSSNCFLSLPFPASDLVFNNNFSGALETNHFPLPLPALRT